MYQLRRPGLAGRVRFPFLRVVGQLERAFEERHLRSADRGRYRRDRRVSGRRRRRGGGGCRLSGRIAGDEADRDVGQRRHFVDGAAQRSRGDVRGEFRQREQIAVVVDRQLREVGLVVRLQDALHLRLAERHLSIDRAEDDDDPVLNLDEHVERLAVVPFERDDPQAIVRLAVLETALLQHLGDLALEHLVGGALRRLAARVGRRQRGGHEECGEQQRVHEASVGECAALYAVGAWMPSGGCAGGVCAMDRGATRADSGSLVVVGL